MPQLKPTDTKPVEEVKTDKDLLQEVNGLIIDNPQAVTIEHVNENGRSFYRWIDNSNQARSTRKEIREILNVYWQSGAHNILDISKKLRLDTREVQGLIDSEYMNKQGLNY